MFRLSNDLLKEYKVLLEKPMTFLHLNSSVLRLDKSSQSWICFKYKDLIKQLFPFRVF